MYEIFWCGEVFSDCRKCRQIHVDGEWADGGDAAENKDEKEKGFLGLGAVVVGHVEFLVRL